MYSTLRYEMYSTFPAENCWDTFAVMTSDCLEKSASGGILDLDYGT